MSTPDAPDGTHPLLDETAQRHFAKALLFPFIYGTSPGGAEKIVRELLTNAEEKRNDHDDTN